ncbi:MAG: hypothetical protein WBG34_12045 [Flavobacteriales bacterium]
MATPDKKAIPEDELERLEQLHLKMKDEAEAWQNLLDGLRKMRTRHTDEPETKPSPE